MIAVACLALGLVLIVEGLAYALAPSLIEQLLAALRALSEDQRRMMGLVAMGLGLVLVWIGKTLGA
jgi:uncharacterized protein YjeT (DUF2065 family)